LKIINIYKPMATSFFSTTIISAFLCTSGVCLNAQIAKNVSIKSESISTIVPSFSYFKKSPYRLFFHTIKDNETAESIAKKYNLSTSEVMKMNNLKVNTTLPFGQELLLEDRNQKIVLQLNTSPKQKKVTPSVLTKFVEKEIAFIEKRQIVDESNYRVLQIENTKVAEAKLVHFISSEDVEDYQKQAAKEGKLLFINFYADWCLPCKVMEESTFKDEEIAIFMHQNCICLHINGDSEKGKTLRQTYAVNLFPTLLFFNGKGNEVARKEGSLGIEDFKGFMITALEKAKANETIGLK
jgi:thiol-disulfide isomerase/thioredoxin